MLLRAANPVTLRNRSGAATTALTSGYWKRCMPAWHRQLTGAV